MWPFNSKDNRPLPQEKDQGLTAEKVKQRAEEVAEKRRETKKFDEQLHDTVELNEYTLEVEYENGDKDRITHQARGEIRPSQISQIEKLSVTDSDYMLDEDHNLLVKEFDSQVVTSLNRDYIRKVTVLDKTRREIPVTYKTVLKKEVWNKAMKLRHDALYKYKAIEAYEDFAEENNSLETLEEEYEISQKREPIELELDNS